MDNHEIARRLQAYARQLEANQGNLYETRAFRRAALTLLGLAQPAAILVAKGGRAQLERLPGIGSHLSFTIEGLIRTGEFHTHPRSRSGRRMASLAAPYS